MTLNNGDQIEVDKRDSEPVGLWVTLVKGHRDMEAISAAMQRYIDTQEILHLQVQLGGITRTISQCKYYPKSQVYLYK
jgi:hypothetical protein